MEKLRVFKTEEEFLNIKKSLEYQQVSLTQDNGKVWVKEEGNYILAKFYVNMDSASTATYSLRTMPLNNEIDGKLPPLDGVLPTLYTKECNEVDGEEVCEYVLFEGDITKFEGQLYTKNCTEVDGEEVCEYVKLPKMSYKPKPHNLKGKPFDGKSIMDNVIDATQMVMTLDGSETITSNYEYGSVDGNIRWYYRDWEIFTDFDSSVVIDKPINQMLINIPNIINEYTYVSYYAPTTDSQTIYKSDGFYPNVIDEHTMQLSEENITLVNEFIEANGGIIIVVEEKQDYIWSMTNCTILIDSVYTINETLTNSGYEGYYNLQVLSYYTFGYSASYYEFDLSQVKEIWINGVKQNEVKHVYENIYSDNDIIEVKYVMNTLHSIENMFCGTDVKEVDFSYLSMNKYNLYDMSGAFADCYQLDTVIFGEQFNTSNVVNMGAMFAGCDVLTRVDMTMFDTRKVESFGLFMTFCNSIEYVDVSSFNNESAWELDDVFNDCNNLKEIKLGKFVTSAAIEIDGMFSECFSLKRLDISKFNTTNVSEWNVDSNSYESTFGGCTSLTEVTLGEYCMLPNDIFLDLPEYGKMLYPCSNDFTDLFEYSLYDTYERECYENVITNKFKIYNEGVEITEGDVIINNISAKYNINEKYWECTYMTTAPTMPLYLNGEKVYDLNWLYGEIVYVLIGDCESLFNIKATVNLNYCSINEVLYNNIENVKSIFINNKQISKNEYVENNNFYYVKIIFDTSNVTDMSSMFSYCRNLTSLDLSSFNTSNVTNMSSMFSYCYNLTSLDLSHFDTSNVTNMRTMFRDCQKLTSLDLSSYNTSKVTDMSSMFYNCYNLTSLDLSHFDTSKVTNMEHMFNNCQNLTSLDLSSFDTSNVTNMNYMFENCSSLTSLDISNFDTSNVTTMINMFSRCSGLTSLDLSSFDTSNVTDMRHMFYNCYGLTSLDVSSFNTSNVTDMRLMFSYCSGLTSLDLSNFDTSNVTIMRWMFQYCYNITSLDLSNFDTSKVTDMECMFLSCTKLTSIEFGYKANVSNVTSYSFMISNVPSTCTLTLCNNVKDSWGKISKPSNTIYVDCTDPSLETNE